LASGDRIVVSGVQNARPGAPVTVVSNESAPQADASVASDAAPARR